MISLVGGTKYDEQSLEDYLRGLKVGIRTGDGQGAEAFVKKIAESLSLEVAVVPKFKAYGNRAMDIQAETVLGLSLDEPDPIVLVGKGSRVDFANGWLKRANWGKEVIRLP
jgi:hypothetical protein